MYKNKEKFVSNVRHSSYNTRSDIEYEPLFQRLTLTQNQSVYYQAPLNWNDIPNTISSIRTFNSFKHNYKNYLIASYNV